MMLRALVVWLVFMVVAILNGAFREGVLSSRIGKATGHVVSTLLLCALIAVVSWVSIVWLNPATPDQAATVAALWVSMTVTFEFGFGHFVAGKSWAVLLADYNIVQGRIWVLVPVTVAAAPYLILRLASEGFFSKDERNKLQGDPGGGSTTEHTEEFYPEPK